MRNEPVGFRALLLSLPMLHSLKVKFVTALVLLVSVVIGLSTWWILSIYEGHMLRATEDKVRVMTEAIEEGIYVAMREGRSHDVQRILEGMRRDPDIERIIIFDTEGRILRASQPELVEGSLIGAACRGIWISRIPRWRAFGKTVG